MKEARGGTTPRLPRLPMVERNRDEIEDLKEVIKVLTKRVHRLELKSGILKKRSNPWMGEVAII